MLIGENTKKLAGVTLYGDYHDLQNLYGDVSEIKHAPGLKDDNLVLNAFLYDIRHAYEGQRIQKTFHKNDELRKVEYFGVNILWPMFIFSVGFFRWGLAFIDSTKSQQANAYRLEQIVHSLLIAADPISGRQCIEWLRKFAGYPQGYLSQYFDECTFRYVFSSLKPKARFSKLSRVIESTFPLSDEYKEFERTLNQKAKEQDCSPHELQSMNEWPEFEM